MGQVPRGEKMGYFTLKQVLRRTIHVDELVVAQLRLQKDLQRKEIMAPGIGESKAGSMSVAD